MKRIILSLLIVLMFSSNSFSQDLKPSGFLFDILFPDVKAQMDDMESSITSLGSSMNSLESTLSKMETQINDLREDYIMYQHFHNVSIGFQSLAATNFGIAGIWFDSSTSYKFEDYWDLGYACIDLSTEALNEAHKYGDKLGIYDNITTAIKLNLNNLKKPALIPEKD